MPRNQRMQEDDYMPGKVDLDALEGAIKPRERSPDEFRPGGNGGAEDFIQAHHIQDERTFDILEPLPQLAHDIGALTYGDKLRFCQEVMTGQKIEPNAFDAMQVDKDAQELAAKLHRWKSLY